MKNFKSLLLPVLGIAIIVSCTKVIIGSSGNKDNSTIIATSSTKSDSINKNVIDKKTPLAHKKYIYLTIDDAPLNGSRYIDSVISATKVKTNIFMVGGPIHKSGKFKNYHESLKKNRFIEIYNHSYSHANHKYSSYYKNPKQVVSDFDKNMKEFKLRHHIARLPGRNLWQLGDRKKNYRQTGSDAAKLLAENGYKIFGWDVEWKYNPKDNSPQQTIDELIEEIENTSTTFTPNHIVLLMHDQMFGKINKNNDLAELIEKLLEHDFTFKYLSDYPDLSENRESVSNASLFTPTSDITSFSPPP